MKSAVFSATELDTVTNVKVCKSVMVELIVASTTRKVADNLYCVISAQLN